jgi:hypothetical protein
MVDERVLEYLNDDLAGDEEVVRLKLLRKRGFLIDPRSDGEIIANTFLKKIDNNELSILAMLN